MVVGKSFKSILLIFAILSLVFATFGSADNSTSSQDVNDTFTNDTNVSSVDDTSDGNTTDSGNLTDSTPPDTADDSDSSDDTTKDDSQTSDTQVSDGSVDESTVDESDTEVQTMETRAGVFEVDGETYVEPFAHNASVLVSPTLVGKDKNVEFQVEVTNAADSPRRIHEFRIYNKSSEFSDFECHPVSGWSGPIYWRNSIGTWCLWTSDSTTESIAPGESKNFTFNAVTPSTGCCREWRFEPRGSLTGEGSGDWLITLDDICVDAQDPITTKTYEGPQKLENGVRWIDGITVVNLTAEDPTPHPSGVNNTYYSYSLVSDDACWNPDTDCNPSATSFTTYAGPFTIPDESCHIIEYYSDDNAGNDEDVNYQCVFVDKTAPTIEKDVGMPHVMVNESYYWVTQNTDVLLNCTDMGNHPSGAEEFCFNVALDGADVTNSYCSSYGGTLDGDYCCVDSDHTYLDFNFMEDSEHVMEYYCTDAVEKQSDIESATFKVDTMAPNITKTMLGVEGQDYIGNCPPESESDICYVADNGVGGLNISVEDEGEICHVDNLTCEYELWWEGQMIDNAEFTDFAQILFENDSTHRLVINCSDGLGNSVSDVEEFLVDSLAPETTKTYGEPSVPSWHCQNWCETDECDGASNMSECLEQCTHQHCSWWLTSQTPITLSVEDEKVGVNKTYYRVLYFDNNSEICYMPDDEWYNNNVDPQTQMLHSMCSNNGLHCHPDYYLGEDYTTDGWKEYNGDIYVENESCHVIEYYSVDHLGNNETGDLEDYPNWQCFYVDNTAPNGTKTVGEPKVVTQEEVCTQDVGITTLASPESIGVESRTINVFQAGTNVDITNWEDGDTTCDDEVCVRGTASAVGGAGQMDLVFVLDSSGSMSGEMDDLKEASKNLVDSLPETSGVRMAVVDFDDNPTLEQGFTSNHASVKSAIDGLVAGGGTDIGEAVNYSNNLLMNNGNSGSAWVEILFNDGSGSYDSQFTTDAADAGIVIHTMGLGIGVDPEVLINISNGTGGTYTYVDDPANLSAAFLGLSLTNIKQVTVNGNVADLSPGGDFEYCNLPLSVGENTVTAVATATDDSTGTEEINVTRLPPENCTNGGGCTTQEVIYLSNMTPITMSCDDAMPHPVQGEEICFKVSYDLPSWGYITEQYCDEGQMNDDEYCCVDASYPEDDSYTLYFENDSMHDLEYYCEDGLGNRNEVDLEYFRVDSIAPNTTKSYLNQFYSNGTVDWIDTNSSIMLNATDGGEICHVDNMTTFYRYSMVDDSWCYDSTKCVGSAQYPTTTKMDVAVDGNLSEWTAEQFFFTDNVGFNHTDGVDEEINNTYNFFATAYNGTLYLGINYADDTTADSVTSFDVAKIFVETMDGDVHFEGGADWQDPGAVPKWQFENGTLVDPNTVGVEMARDFWDGSRSYEVAVPMDLLGLSEGDTIKVGVYLLDGTQKTQHRIRNSMPDYNSFDWFDSSNWMEFTIPWMEYDGEFEIPEESCHMIEYFSEDGLGNKELIKNQCVFVDKTAPEISKTYHGPQFLGEEEVELEPFYMGSKGWTSELFNFTETWDCEGSTYFGWSPATLKKVYDDEHLKFIIGLPDKIEGGENFWFEIDADNDGQADYQFSYHNDITQHYPGSHWSYREHNGTAWSSHMALPGWINGYMINDTTFSVTMELDMMGNQNGMVDDYGAEYGFAGFLVQGDEGFPQGVCDPGYSWPGEAVIVPMQAEDGKFIVESVPMPRWISNKTEISFEAEDLMPHPSGMSHIDYRVSLVDESNCWDECSATGTGTWTNYTGNFTIDEDSCHLIEAWAYDNVGKKTYHKQCVFVDSQAPVPNKTVEEPKEVWDGKSAMFYNISHRCWNESSDEYIECWEITRETPINLECVDPEPHPVDHNVACYNVELDGEDVTEQYCNGDNERTIGFFSVDNGDETYGFNVSGDGYCCVPEGTEFMFGENSEHNLKYYCKDALDNIGEIDEEKFKVEGTDFKVHLYKKWNLISVPFSLLNDDPAAVFGDLENIESVWTYDNVNDEWLVWSPGNATDDLNHIKPGWGYWVFMKEDENLTVGGALFKEGANMPPSKTLTPGWNLIGYYGSSWELYDGMEDYESYCGKRLQLAQFIGPDGRYVYGDKIYCALSSLIDTQEGYPRWSSVWSYINCGNHNDGWLGLNACADPNNMQTMVDRMYAGRGYWVEMDVQDLYAPATTCIWNDDNFCQMTGGGYMP